MQRYVVSAVVLLCLFISPDTARAKSGPSIYTDARQANARANAAYPWSEAASHRAYAQEWLNRDLPTIHELVYHPSLPRAKAPSYSGLCPNGKPLRGWYVNPDWYRFKVKCMDTDDSTPDEWYPQNDFAAHYEANRLADGTYQWPGNDSTHCDTGTAWHDCGYGAVYDGRKYYFVAFYVYTVLKNLARLDLGDPLNGRSFVWSGALTSVFEGPGAGDEAALRVALVLHAFADHFEEAPAWYPVHLQREPGLAAYLDGEQGVVFGRMSDGIAMANLIRAYDIVWRSYDDARLLSVLADLHSGEAPGNVREPIENMFWAAAARVPGKTIWGNASLPHALMILLAFVLDGGERSQALLDWVFAEGQGRLPELYFQSMDRDGGTDEVSPGYMAIGFDYHLITGELLELYARRNFSLTSNLNMPWPAWRRIRYRLALHFGFLRQLETIPGFYVHLGDDGRTGRAGPPPRPSKEKLTLAYELFGPDERLALQAVEANGGAIDGLHTSIWDRDPYAVQRGLARDVRKARADLLESPVLAGYGFAQLKGGSGNGQHSVWAYFGRSQSPRGGFGRHAHHDQLDFGIQYAGLDFMPTPGSPRAFDWRYFGWHANTGSHNSVLVDRTRQSHHIWASNLKTYLNTDGSPVALMELESDTAYPGVYEWPAMLPEARLRRSLLRVEIGGGRFFVVEFSSTSGGSVHHYSYHGGGDAVTLPRGPQLTPTTNTYAGVDSGAFVAWGEPYDFAEVDAACRSNMACVEAAANLYRGSGFQFLTEASYADTVTGSFLAEWNQFDWTSRGLTPARLRAWMTPVGAFDQLASATGGMPFGEPVGYLLLRGRNAGRGTGMVNVWEPVLDAPAVASVRTLHADIEPAGLVAVVEIVLTDGRTIHLGFDAAGETYRRFGPLGWKGLAAVYAEESGVRRFAWIGRGEELRWNGGIELAGLPAACVGPVERIHESDGSNSISVGAKCDAGVLVNRWADMQPAVPVRYDAFRDATYRLFGASTRGKSSEFDLGAVPLIEGLLDAGNYDAGFNFAVKPGDTVTVPFDWWK